MYEHLLISETEGILTITLNRPEKLNAFIGHMRRDLAEALEHAGSDRSVRVVVITGAGRAFCAGGDVAFMAELMQRRDSEEFSRILGAGRRVILAIRQMTKPVIAAINGPASGAGCNLAFACDLRIASSAQLLVNRLRKSDFIRIGVALIFCRVSSRRTKRVRCSFWATASTPRRLVVWESLIRWWRRKSWKR